MSDRENSSTPMIDLMVRRSVLRDQFEKFLAHPGVKNFALLKQEMVKYRHETEGRPVSI